MYTLAYYTAKAKGMATGSLRFALQDIKGTLDCWKDHPPTEYTRKLWAEWDAYIVELERRG